MDSNNINMVNISNTNREKLYIAQQVCGKLKLIFNYIDPQSGIEFKDIKQDSSNLPRLLVFELLELMNDFFNIDVYIPNYRYYRMYDPRSPDTFLSICLILYIMIFLKDLI